MIELLLVLSTLIVILLTLIFYEAEKANSYLGRLVGTMEESVNSSLKDNDEELDKVSLIVAGNDGFIRSKEDVDVAMMKSTSPWEEDELEAEEIERY